MRRWGPGDAACCSNARRESRPCDCRRRVRCPARLAGDHADSDIERGQHSTRRRCHPRSFGAGLRVPGVGGDRPAVRSRPSVAGVARRRRRGAQGRRALVNDLGRPTSAERAARHGGGAVDHACSSAQRCCCAVSPTSPRSSSGVQSAERARIPRRASAAVVPAPKPHRVFRSAARQTPGITGRPLSRHGAVTSHARGLCAVIQRPGPPVRTRRRAVRCLSLRQPRLLCGAADPRDARGVRLPPRTPKHHPWSRLSTAFRQNGIFRTRIRSARASTSGTEPMGTSRSWAWSATSATTASIRHPIPQVCAVQTGYVRRMWMVVRTAGDPEQFAGTARQAVRELDAGLPAFSMTPLNQRHQRLDRAASFLGAAADGVRPPPLSARRRTRDRTLLPRTTRNSSNSRRS